MQAILLLLVLFTDQAFALDNVDNLNTKSFLFGKRTMSAEVFKRGSYFIHLREIRSESFKSNSNPKGYYLFPSGNSLKTGNAFCKSILGKNYIQTMTDADSLMDGSLKARLREIRCQREKVLVEILREQNEACQIFQKPTPFSPNCANRAEQYRRVSGRHNGNRSYIEKDPSSDIQPAVRTLSTSQK